MEVLDAIQARRSVRSFKTDPISKEVLTKIVDAGRLAPTARNVQPCEFIVVTDAALRRRIADITDHGKFIAEASACVVVLARSTKYYLEDGVAATTSMLIAAHGLELGACWVAGDKKEYAPSIVALCGAPSDLKLVSLIALGYPADIPSPEKRPLDELVHWESY